MVIGVDQTVERLLTDEYFLWGSRLDFFLHDKMMTVLCIVGQQEIFISFIVEHSVVNFLIIETISEVEGDSIVIHILKQCQHKSISVDHDFLGCMLNQFREDNWLLLQVNFKGLIGYFSSEKYLRVDFIHIVDLDEFVIIFVE